MKTNNPTAEIHSMAQAGRVSLIHNAKKKCFIIRKAAVNGRAEQVFGFVFTKVEKVKGSTYFTEGLSSHLKLKHRAGDRISVGSRRKEKNFFPTYSVFYL